jgi:parallel beta-helix repeat protein
MSGMTVTNACIFGIAASGQNNRVDTSVVTRSGLDGIGIGAASGTYIVSNDISGNARVGVDISNFSNNNFVMNNIINSNGIRDGEQGGVAIFNGTNNLVANNALNHNFNGIEIESPGNLIRGNTVSGSSNTGIFITTVGSPSTVKYNTVLGSVIAAMSDDTCGVNTWRNNTFQTDLVAGVSDGGPGTGCIRSTGVRGMTRPDDFSGAD